PRRGSLPEGLLELQLAKLAGPDVALERTDVCRAAIEELGQGLLRHQLLIHCGTDKGGGLALAACDAPLSLEQTAGEAADHALAHLAHDLRVWTSWREVLFAADPRNLFHPLQLAAEPPHRLDERPVARG